MHVFTELCCFQVCSTFLLPRIILEKQDTVATNYCRIKDIIVSVTYYRSLTPLWRSPRTTSAAQKTAFITTTARYHELRCRQSILEPFQLFVVSWRYQLSWPLDLSHSFRSDIRTVVYWSILHYIRLLATGRVKTSAVFEVGRPPKTPPKHHRP